MEIQLTLNGRSRKDAARCVGEALSLTPIYRRAPTYAYTVGTDVEIDRDGFLIIPDDCEKLSAVLAALQAAGFCVPAEVTGAPEADEEPQQPSQLPEVPLIAERPDCLVIQMPLDGFNPTSLDNLGKLVESKATLIRKAIGAELLPIAMDGDVLNFPWFSMDSTAEEVKAYTHFITTLCDMAKKQVRVLTTEKPVENEKYAFRCFLLRLGFIGEEYAEARRLLLRNLSGNGSNKSGERKPKPVPPSDEAVGAEKPPAAEVVPEPPKSKFSFKKLFATLKTMALD